MLITVIVDLESIIEWVFLGATIVICILIWIVGAIADGMGERKRKKQYEEYDRKYGEGSEADEAEHKR